MAIFRDVALDGAAVRGPQHRDLPLRCSVLSKRLRGSVPDVDPAGSRNFLIHTIVFRVALESPGISIEDHAAIEGNAITSVDDTVCCGRMGAPDCLVVHPIAETLIAATEGRFELAARRTSRNP